MRRAIDVALRSRRTEFSCSNCKEEGDRKYNAQAQRKRNEYMVSEKKKGKKDTKGGLPNTLVSQKTTLVDYSNG